MQVHYVLDSRSHADPVGEETSGPIRRILAQHGVLFTEPPWAGGGGYQGTLGQEFYVGRSRRAGRSAKPGDLAVCCKEREITPHEQLVRSDRRWLLGIRQPKLH